MVRMSSQEEKTKRKLDEEKKNQRASMSPQEKGEGRKEKSGCREKSKIHSRHEPIATGHSSATPCKGPNKICRKYDSIIKGSGAKQTC